MLASLFAAPGRADGPGGNGGGENLVEWWVCGDPPAQVFILIDNGWDGMRAAGLAIAEWMSLLLFAFAILGIVQRFALAARLQR